jgi:hypothetical protein
MCRPSWETVRHLLADWDGGASELFVIDLPKSHFRRVVAVIAGLPDLEITAHPREILEKPEAFDSRWAERLQASSPQPGCYAFRSASGSREHLQVYLETAVDLSCDVEFVFWNDLTFPTHLSEEELSTRLERLISLAEGTRIGAPDSRCILSTEHNGDPRELLSLDGVVVW